MATGPALAIGNKKGGFVFINDLKKLSPQEWKEARPRVRFPGVGSMGRMETADATGGSAATGGALRVTRNGPFFTAKENASHYEVAIPIARDASYATATISFNALAPSFPGPALHSIVEMVNPGLDGHKGRYFAIQHTLLRVVEKGIRTNIDNLIHGFSTTRTDLMEKVHTGGGASLRYRVVYDTSNRSVSVEITDTETGLKNAFTETRTNKEAVLVEEADIKDAGGGLVVRLGLDRTYDHGGYYPPYGWAFSDLAIELTGAGAGGREE